MTKGSALARLKKRAQKALEKTPENRSYKETKDVSNWRAIEERWAAMEGNQYARGLVRTEGTLEKMREAQGMRRKRELNERIHNATQKKMGSDSSDD
jgi:hypothetical protein